MSSLHEQAWWKRITTRVPFRLLLLAVIAPGAVAYGFLLNSAAEANSLLQRFGYFSIALTFGWWVLAMVRIARQEPGLARVVSLETVKRHRAVSALIVAFTAVAWLTVPYSCKVLYDEFVLQSTAFNLHFFRELGTMVRAHEVEGVFRSLHIYLDKRPFFYPFLLSLVHDLTGYRVLNAFVLNTVLMPVVLGLVYLIARQLGGRRAALVGVACFGASPLLAQNANGAGMEMLNLAMFLTTLALAVYYLRKPDEPRLSALVLSCLLLAQSRYESALYVGCVAVVIIEGWRRSGRVILPLAALCAPLLLIPYALHSTYLSGTPMLWELRADEATRFGRQYLPDNLGHAFSYFFEISPQLLNTWWLSMTGVAALGWVLVLLWRRRAEWRVVPPVVFASLVMGLGVVLNLGLLMFYYWGQLDDPIVSRLALPFYLMLAFAVAAVAGTCREEWRPRLCVWLITGALLSYLATGLWAAAYNEKINQLAYEIEWEEQWVAQRPPLSRLIITNKSCLNWMVGHISAISTDVGRNRADKVKFHMEAGTFREVLVIQYYRPTGPEGGFTVDPHDALPPTFELEPLVERQVGAKLSRISRVVAIHPADKPPKVELEGSSHSEP